MLRLSADDSALSSTDDITVTVKTPTNQAPVVNAGPDATVTLSTTTALPATASLDGTVTDDGLPLGSRVTTGWTQGLRARHRHLRRPHRHPHHRQLRHHWHLRAAPHRE